MRIFGRAIYNISLMIDEESNGYIGEAGGIYLVEEWKEIIFENTKDKTLLIVDGKPVNNPKRNTAHKLIYTFQNRLGYADVDINGGKIRLLVLSQKVFGDSDWENLKKDPGVLIDKFNKTFDGYLQDLCKKATKLPFEIDPETHWPAERGSEPTDPFWKLVFLKNHREEIREALRFVMARPHASLVGEKRWVRQEQVRRLSPNALVAALTRPGNLLNDDPAFLSFPDIVPRSTFDNPENRFVRFATETWLSDLVSLRQILGEDRKPLPGLADLADSLTEALFSAPLSEAGQFNGIPATSTVLAKAPGYRDIRRLWAEYQRAMRVLPDLEEAVNLKKIDVIWEYWVLFKLMDALNEALGGGTEKWRVSVKGTLPEGQGAVFENGKVKLHYNQTKRSYSNIPLRPDFLMEICGHRFVFDAKFRLDWEEIEEKFAKEDELIESDESNYESLAKAADIVKMHAYRDAIKGVQGAFVIYPGKNNALFPYGDIIPTDMALLLGEIYGGLDGFLKTMSKWPYFNGVGFFGLKIKTEGKDGGREVF